MLTEKLPPGGGIAVHALEHDDEPPLPLHAVPPLPFGLNIQLACAVCTGILTITTTAAIVATVTANTTPVNATLLLVVLAFEFAILLYNVDHLYEL